MFSVPQNVSNRLLSKFRFTLKQNIHSIVPDVVIPNMHLEECIWKKLERWHNKTALVCAQTNRSYTYLQLHKKSNALTSFLCNLDKLKQSDTVTVALPNLPEYAIIILGVIQAGCKVTTMNPLFTSGEMSYQLIRAETKVIFATTESYKTVQIGLQLSKLHIPIIVVRERNDSTLPPGAIDFDEITRHHCDAKFDLHKRSHDETVLMLFSSGTTGLPKAVEITSRGLVSCLHQISAPKLDAISETSEFQQEVVPVVLPMYHVYGLVVVLLHGLLKGSKLVVVPKFSSKLFVNVLETYNPTVLYVVPPIFHMMLNRNYIKPSHFTNTKSITSAAAPLGATDVTALSEKLQGKVEILQAYGLTEVGLSHVQSSQIDGHRKPGGIGFLLPSTEAKIMSTTTGNEVGTNQQGEMFIRGPQVMKGYYNDQNANDAAFTNDGWFKTGDLGYYDEDGHFFVTDRLKNFIKVSGYQVTPAELEELIRRHKDVDDVAVIGVPHKKFGEVPKAFVVRRRDSNVSSLAIQEFVKSEVVHYKQLIGGISFVDSIPKSLAGKILKMELKKY